MINQHLYLKKSNSVVTWIQKNACTAINASVAVANGIIESADKFNWMYANESKATIEQIENADYRFVFLRNPLDRLMSAFYDDKVRKQSSDFESFVNDFDLKENIHWTPQADFLLSDYDAVFDIGNLEYANCQLKSAINFHIADIRGMHDYGINQYSKDCSDKAKELVKKLYAVDYLLYEGVNHGSA